MSGYRISEDKKRAVERAPFAFACYEGEFIDGKMCNGLHVGIHVNGDDAKQWLETGEPEPTRIYPVRRSEEAAS